MEKPLTVGITIGDPGSVGPEILLKALALPLPAARYVVFGSRRLLDEHARMLSLKRPDNVSIEDIDNIPSPYFGPQPDIGGQASIDYLEAAFRSFEHGDIQALVTGPIQKEAWHRAGFNYAGQTEYCAAKTRTTDFFMLMVSNRFRIALLSTHKSLRDALHNVDRDTIIGKIQIVDREFRRLGFAKPRIGCAALNPHAGEAGAFGTEEQTEITPALEVLRKQGIAVEGPIAPEVIFRIAAAEARWDVIFAMYHDQAMIPLKLLDFHSSANVTLGLPLIRTSPDHGTAFDIAGKGVADPGSMRVAIELAVDWTQRRI